MDYVSRIDRQIRSKHLLDHPFYQAWTRGELSKECLRDYAENYYHHVAAFPRYLSAVHTKTECPKARRFLLQNLIDEEAGNPNHPDLWKSFVETLGGSTEEHQPIPEVNEMIETFFDRCHNGSIAEGIAALYAYESQIPAVSESKIEGLKAFYGMSDPKDWEYFSVHIEADKEHAEAEKKILERAVAEENWPSVQKSVQQVLDQLWNFLSALCERHQVACAC